MANRSRADIRRKIHSRIRKKVHGTGECPRLAIFRSPKHIYAQVIDDVSSETLVAASTTDSGFKGKAGGNIEAAQAIGKLIAERAIKKGIDNVVYDRGGYVYHGRIKALIDASKEAGLNKNGAEETKAEKDDSKPKAKKESSKPKKQKKAKEDKKETEPKKEKKTEKKKVEKKAEKTAAKKDDKKSGEEEE